MTEVPMDEGTAEQKEKLRKARIVFMGTPSVAGVILRRLLQEGWNVGGVVTQPDRPRGRGRKVMPSPVKEVAHEFDIPVLQPKSLKDQADQTVLEDLRPDLILTAAYGRILPTRILKLPPLGCFNVHFSLLPAYRGPAPVAWAIINGERKTGITIFLMEEGTDTGDVIAARSVEIGEEETAGELIERLAGVAVDLVPAVLRDVILGKATYKKQDPALATEAPLLRKADGLIDWGLPAAKIANRIRGLNPWPGAFTFWHRKRIRLWAARVEDETCVEFPGKILVRSEEGLKLATGEGVLCVLSLQMEGKKRMEVAEFIRGHGMQAGDRLDQGP